MRERLLACAVLTAALCAFGSVARASEISATSLAQQALNECEAGRQITDRSARAERFTRGEEIAEKAVALDDQCAQAHFALFCNRGESMRLDGESIRDVLQLRGLLRELDRTIELEPDHAGALSAKGTFLVRLPR